MLILDLEAQQRIQALIARAAQQPLTRSAIEQQSVLLGRGGSLGIDPTRCLLLRENYLVAFCFEDAPDIGLARHLAVSPGHPGEPAVEMLKREFGITSPSAELMRWFQAVPGRGTAIHLVEPVTLANAGAFLTGFGLLAPSDDFVPPPPDELDEEEAAA